MWSGGSPRLFLHMHSLNLCGESAEGEYKITHIWHILFFLLTTAFKDGTKPDMLGNLLWIREGTSVHAGGFTSQQSEGCRCIIHDQIQSLLWDPPLHLSRSHLTALLRAGVRSHPIHFAITRKIAYMSYMKHLSTHFNQNYTSLGEKKSWRLYFERMWAHQRSRTVQGLSAAKQARTPATICKWDVTCCQFSSSEGMAEK